MTMIVDRDNGCCLARFPHTAVSFADRLRGLIGRRFDDTMDGMIFPRCGAVHTCFMGMAVDLLFLDRSDRVVRIDHRVPPWMLCRRHAAAVTVVELPPGRLASAGVAEGHQIVWSSHL